MKVLISSLGKGPRDRTEKDPDAKNREYKETEYVFNHETEKSCSYRTSFVTMAISEQFMVDRILLFGTTGSMWDKFYYFFAEHRRLLDEQLYLDLVEYLSTSSKDYKSNFPIEIFEKINKSFGGALEFIPLWYGMNDGESTCNQLLIFAQMNRLIGIAEEYDDDVEVVLDITHSFRSQAVQLLTMMQYVQTASKGRVHIKTVLYGMHEMIDFIGKAPVVDVTSSFRILDLSSAASEFVKYGSGYGMVEILKKREMAIKDKQVRETLQSMRKAITSFSDLQNLQFLREIRKELGHLKMASEKFRSLSTINLGSIEDRLIFDVLQRFQTQLASQGEHEDARFQLEMAAWFYKSRRYGQAFLVLYESMLTLICNLEKLDANRDDHRARLRDFLATDERANGKSYKNSSDERLQELSSLANQIRDTRNTVAHASLKKGKITKMEIVNLEDTIGKFKKLLPRFEKPADTKEPG
jgi:CRISPR-associated Csx2 family protein